MSKKDYIIEAKNSSVSPPSGDTSSQQDTEQI